MYFLKYWFRIIFNQNKLRTAALMNATAYCSLNYSEQLNRNKYCSILKFFTTVNCSVV